MSGSLNEVSACDRRVLGAILNPLFPDLLDEQLPDAAEPPGRPLSAEQQASRQAELQGIKAAESGQLQQALAAFEQAIRLSPRNASCYNNRAQTYRLLRDNESARSDLDKAIELTGGQGKTAASAYTQRAMLHRLHGQDELAKLQQDYEAAAAQGCVFAKNQLVVLNPYAAMCNQMLSEVIGRLQRGETDEPNESRAA